jgi:DNA-binding NtrC family response regulator
VRELKNVLERALLVERGEVLRPAALLDRGGLAYPDCVAASPAAGHGSGTPRTLADLEREHILSVFNQNDGNLTRSAAVLDISLSTLRAKLRAIGVPPGGGRRTSADAENEAPESGERSRFTLQ